MHRLLGFVGYVEFRVVSACITFKKEGTSDRNFSSRLSAFSYVVKTVRLKFSNSSFLQASSIARL